MVSRARVWKFFFPTIRKYRTRKKKNETHSTIFDEHNLEFFRNPTLNFSEFFFSYSTHTIPDLTIASPLHTYSRGAPRVLMTENTESPLPKPYPAYFLGSNDNPRTIITPIQSKDDNFDEWARAIHMSLNAKRKLGFLEGTITKPNTPEKLAD